MKDDKSVQEITMMRSFLRLGAPWSMNIVQVRSHSSEMLNKVTRLSLWNTSNNCFRPSGFTQICKRGIMQNYVNQKQLLQPFHDNSILTTSWTFTNLFTSEVQMQVAYAGFTKQLT